MGRCSQTLQGSKSCLVLPSTDGTRSHRLHGLLACAMAVPQCHACVCMCTHMCVLHHWCIMRMHNWGSTALQNRGTCPTSAWGRDEW